MLYGITIGLLHLTAGTSTDRLGVIIIITALFDASHTDKALEFNQW